MNLIEGIQEEIRRAEALRKVYDDIPAGNFGVMLIDDVVHRARQSLATRDHTEMLEAYAELKELGG